MGLPPISDGLQLRGRNGDAYTYFGRVYDATGHKSPGANTRQGPVQARALHRCWTLRSPFDQIPATLGLWHQGCGF